MGPQEAARADEDADAAWSANADRGHFPPRLRIPSWWRRTTISSSRSPPPRARARTTPRRSRWSTISTTRTLNRFGGDREHGRPGRTEFLYHTCGGRVNIRPDQHKRLAAPPSTRLKEP